MMRLASAIKNLDATWVPPYRVPIQRFWRENGQRLTKYDLCDVNIDPFNVVHYYLDYHSECKPYLVHTDSCKELCHCLCRCGKTPEVTSTKPDRSISEEIEDFLKAASDDELFVQALDTYESTL